MSGEPVGRFEWEQALRETPGISLPLRGVLSLMATHADFETGESIKPSLTKMAKRLEVSRRTLTKHVGEGVQIEWLGCTEDNRLHGTPSVYRLTRPTGGESNTAHPLALSRTGGESNTAHPLALSRTGGESNTAQGVSQILRTTYTPTSSPISTSTSTAEPTGEEHPGCTHVGKHAWCGVEANAKAAADAKAKAALAAEMGRAPDFD